MRHLGHKAETEFSHFEANNVDGHRVEDILPPVLNLAMPMAANNIDHDSSEPNTCW